MCGLAGGAVAPATVEQALAGMSHRGPDATGMATVGTFTLGHVRLSIQDLTSASDQPWRDGPLTVTYNGEAWQPEALRARLPAREWHTVGDTEVVAALLSQHGLDALPLLDRAMFALAWTDDRYGTLWLARDQFGEIPLHIGRTRDNRVVYASELATLLALGAAPSTVRWFPPGSAMRIDPDGRQVALHKWAPRMNLRALPATLGQAAREVRDRLTRGVLDRLTSDAPIAVLASGGLDSSAIIGLIRTHRPDVELVAYTAVHDRRSRDLTHARNVASRWEIPLVEVPVPDPTARDLDRIVDVIEQPHKAQVEIGWACDRLAAAIHADGRRVVLSGEGSDELWASYGLSYHGIKAKGFGPYRHELFTGQHRKNFPRTNKVFMRHGIEARLPFLDPSLVGYALQLPQAAVRETGNPKAVLAHATADVVTRDIGWRPKVAFQTGAGIDKTAARTIPNPRAHYTARFKYTFQGVTP